MADQDKDAVIFEGSNEVRCSYSLALLGHYIVVDNIRYIIKLKNDYNG